MMMKRGWKAEGNGWKRMRERGTETKTVRKEIFTLLSHAMYASNCVNRLLYMQVHVCWHTRGGLTDAHTHTHTHTRRRAMGDGHSKEQAKHKTRQADPKQTVPLVVVVVVSQSALLSPLISNHDYFVSFFHSVSHSFVHSLDAACFSLSRLSTAHPYKLLLQSYQQ